MTTSPALNRFLLLHRAQPTSLTLPSQIAITILCILIGYTVAFISTDSLQLGSYLAQSFIWLFGIILFTDLGGHFNDTTRHLTFWLNFFPHRLSYLLTLTLTFLATALTYSTLTTLATLATDAALHRDIALLPAIPQAILHQTLALTIIALLSHTLGSWLHSGLRQMITLSLATTIFFLSSIIPYFFSFNDPLTNLLFELLPRIDLFDNRNSLLVALAPYPWKYTAQITTYALAQTTLLTTLTWLKLHTERWK